MVETAPSIRADGSQHGAFVHIWSADARKLAPIRARVHHWLAPLRLTTDAEDDIVYAVNEAVSNVVEHAYAPATGNDTIELSFWTEAGALCITIADHGKWQAPTLASPELSGRGIPVMQRLIDSVLIHHNTAGTEVFLRHALPGKASRRSSVGRG